MHRSKFQILLSFILLFNIAEHLWYQKASIEDDPIEILQEEISENAEESENTETDVLDSFDGEATVHFQGSFSFLKSFLLNAFSTFHSSAAIPKLYILYGQLKICIA